MKVKSELVMKNSFLPFSQEGGERLVDAIMSYSCLLESSPNFHTFSDITQPVSSLEEAAAPSYYTWVKGERSSEIELGGS